MPMSSKTFFGDSRKLSITFSEDVEKALEKKGYPRFKSKGQYKSITYPESGFKLEGSRLTLSKISGSIRVLECSSRVFKHREIEGTIKTCTIKKGGTDSLVCHIRD
jgi:putative transposase